MDVMTSTIRNADSDLIFQFTHLGTPHSLQGTAFQKYYLVQRTKPCIFKVRNVMRKVL